LQLGQVIRSLLFALLAPRFVIERSFCSSRQGLVHLPEFDECDLAVTAMKLCGHFL
jgi:hypothetical protein